ncbi:MAG TPA: ABC transporter permease, partial [Bacteroidales bacterium]|nr:ABC transporter permease [Bacteroidales bacterium]
MVTWFNLSGFVLCFFALSLVISYVYSELRTDSLHKNRDSIYAVSPYPNGTWVPYILIDFMKDNSAFNKVIPYGFDWNKVYLKNGENIPVESDAIFVDSSFFDAFSFEFIAGDRTECVTIPFTVVITRSEAKRLFGDENPVGRKLKYNSKNELTVSAVIKDYPKNSIFKSKSFISFNTLKILQPGTFNCGWNCYNLKAFVMLRSANDKETALSELQKILKKNKEDEPGIKSELISLHDFYFGKSYETPSQMRKGDMTNVIIFSLFGALIFIIALFNYFNLSVASLIQKRRETAMLKIFGSSFIQQWTLISFEAFIVAAFASVVGIFLKKAFLTTSFGSSFSFSGQISSDIISELLPFLVTVVLVIIAGLAGALYIKKRPVNDIYGNVRSAEKNSLRMLMLIAQFGIVTFLLGATLEIHKQVRFMQNTDPGFAKENLICIEADFRHKTSEAVFKSEFMSIPGIKEVAFSDAIPGVQTQNWSTDIIVDGQKKNIEVAAVPVWSGFLETYGFRLKEGRFFSDTIDSDFGNIVINESAAKMIGWKDPVGQKIFERTRNKRKMGGVIVGVIEDNYFQSMYKTIGPLAFFNLPNYSSYITLKTVSGYENQKQILAAAKQKWDKLEPDYPFTFFYFDQHLDQLYHKETELGNLTLLLSVISIIITGLGLIGVSLFIARKKTKEIGIRRVNGATTQEIVRWLNTRFYLSLAVAIILALPLLWWFMNRWLGIFAYHADFPLWILAVSAFATVLVAYVCITWQSLR